MDLDFDCSFTEAIQDVVLAFQIAPCLHSRRPGDLKVLLVNDTPVSIYTPYGIVAIRSGLFYDEFYLTTVFEASSCCVDLLYDYEFFLLDSKVRDGIAYYPECVPLPKVIVVGAGLFGLMAVTELLHASVKI
ncbi:hypothetical protein PanWU01x14_102210 [Parasponia andersonii]|uniref:FAD/NAD(P)-binding domain containing protein n=1 Tax=Parasponia andersonii TaxID=3476 RepID=A0A2P5D2T4_PARAD|nr:hypothetical protein PanWU01x14_102210 [Parasponia andersonii]